MAKKPPTDTEKQLEAAMDGWTSVNRQANPVEWQRWINFRREYLGSNLVIDTLTVPSPFPPSSQDAISRYLDAVELSRRCAGWNGTKKLTEPHGDRPRLWWLIRPYLWDPSWKKEDIPAAEYEPYMKFLAAMRKKDAEGWGVNDRYGFWHKWHGTGSTPIAAE
jgi:hypothetical protein